MGTEFRFGKMKDVLEMAIYMHSSVNILNVHFKMVNFMLFYFITIKKNI